MLLKLNSPSTVLPVPQMEEQSGRALAVLSRIQSTLSSLTACTSDKERQEHQASFRRLMVELLRAPDIVNHVEQLNEPLQYALTPSADPALRQLTFDADMRAWLNAGIIHGVIAFCGEPAARLSFNQTLLERLGTSMPHSSMTERACLIEHTSQSPRGIPCILPIAIQERHQ